MYDSIVIGGGPAGMSAAIYLVRKKLKTLLLAEEFGGQAAKSSEIENYLGFNSISGPELLGKFVEHIETLGVESESGQPIKKVEKTAEGFKVFAGENEYETKTIIVASGKMPRRLGLKREEEFLGKGISYCAICDGPLFRDKKVAVVGGGNSALDAAIEIEKYASKVYIFNINNNFQGDEVRIDHVRESKNIEVIAPAKVTEVSGEQFLKSLKYEDLKTNQVKELAVDGIFVEVGWEPATGFLNGLVELNNLKEIVVDRENNTSLPGIFAAGDVTDIKEKQIIIAAGEGAKAALRVWQYLVTNKKLK